MLKLLRANLVISGYPKNQYPITMMSTMVLFHFIKAGIIARHSEGLLIKT